MTSVIKFLEHNDISQLSNIKIARNEEKNVFILNYEQIPTDKKGFGKHHPIIRECRNLIIRDKPWRVMSRSFKRFFNWGEDQEETRLMTQAMAEGKVTASEKFDGSLITVVYFDDKWHVFTRGADADTNPFRGMSFMDAGGPADTFGRRVRRHLSMDILQTDTTYVFELCTPGAHITHYDQEFIVLLSANKNGVELDHYDPNLPYQIVPHLDEFMFNAKDLLHRDTVVRSIDEVNALFLNRPPDFEGFVLKYYNAETGEYHRMKLKSKSYIELHHLKSKQHTFEDLVVIVIQLEEAEVLAVCPEFKDELNIIKILYEATIENLDEFMLHAKDLSRRDFALRVGDRPMKWALFDIHAGKYPNALTALSNQANKSKVAKGLMDLRRGK